MYDILEGIIRSNESIELSCIGNSYNSNNINKTHHLRLACALSTDNLKQF